MRRLLSSPTVVLLAALCAAPCGCAARGAASHPPTPSPEPSAQDIINEFQPDRPDVANGTHVVPIALAQLEAGGSWARLKGGADSAGTPLSLRLGVCDWLEARVESAGLDYEKDGRTASLGFNGLQVGGKIRFSDAFAVLPSVNLPVGEKSGTDYTLTLITGGDFGGRNHVDVNLALASTAGDDGHFFQRWLAISANRQVTDRFSPYLEVAWFSSQQQGGGRVAWMDGGFIFTLNERLALDAGASVGLSTEAPRGSFFAGLTTILGEVHGGHGVHGRLREAAIRHAK